MCLRFIRRAFILHLKAIWKITNFPHYHSINVDERIVPLTLQVRLPYTFRGVSRSSDVARPV